MIAMQGQSVVIRMKHVISGDESIFKGIITEIGMDGERCFRHYPLQGMQSYCSA